MSRTFWAWRRKGAKMLGRVGLIAVGYGGKHIEEFVFDWLLYGAIVTYSTNLYGAVWGSLMTFAIMAPISAVMCYMYIRVYDWAEKDFFGFELAKQVRDKQHRRGFLGIVHRIAEWGDIPAFFAFSIYFDPFMTTMYLRKGSEKYNGMTRRDHYIFFSSVFVSNAYWTLQLTVLVELARFLWCLFSSAC
ncbi:MAG: hypothetical protein RLZZ283_225 [Candidatus Parcubacteria bacterium]